MRKLINLQSKNKNKVAAVFVAITVFFMNNSVYAQPKLITAKML